MSFKIVVLLLLTFYFACLTTPIDTGFVSADGIYHAPQISVWQSLTGLKSQPSLWYIIPASVSVFLIGQMPEAKRCFINGINYQKRMFRRKAKR